MKAILVPTDFSKNAYSALQYATQLFAGETCKFIIMHSFENQLTKLTSRVDIGKTEAVAEELYDTYEAKCEEIKHQIILDTENKQHDYKIIVTSLSLSYAINIFIDKEQVDFVVMGSKGSTSANDILMGSNTLSVIQRIKKAPLLVIPREFNFKPIKNIAFATGFKRAYSINELQALSYLSTLSNANIKVLHIHKKEKLNNTQHANFHQLFELLKDHKPESNWLPNDSDNYDAITSYLNKAQTGLLAMIFYKHNVIVRLFREATVKNIAKYTLIPFLILPTQE
ncbi:universal stress protein [Ulvibacter antarcticus]|uniref:Nucleotide-binding universal stress UspA family protein n=1 Tax=Ulvibacter antarcticus TaxID=442714 RepID=A0A3L9YGT5_9FLAO|nr:universal stress protein [Ulvibacter antarcticus]RMA58767.1 nucleotide-binding universal stress UspA family protein [Ulvibacter antarcticus]